MSIIFPKFFRLCLSNSSPLYWRAALYTRLTHPSSGLRAQSALFNDT
nr:MAG TPA_asm: hypothetical protein [Caudoviricetes sp.]